MTPRPLAWVAGLPNREPRKGSKSVDREYIGVRLGRVEDDRPIPCPSRDVQETGR